MPREGRRKVDRGKNVFVLYLCPNKGHLNSVEDQVVEVMRLLLSFYLTVEFLCKAKNNKQ